MKKTGESGGIPISRVWTAEERTLINNFLVHAKALLATKDFIIQPTPKNKAFQKRYPLRSDDQIAILRSLQVEDCVAVEPNDNPRYSDSTVFKFIKEVEITVLGETELVEIYIKEYIEDRRTHEIICVISFHEEGLHD